MYKEYEFVNVLKSYEIIIDGEMIHISGKYGGSANINSIQSIKYTKGNPLLIRKGGLFFALSGSEIGVIWDPPTLSKYKVMNEQAEEISAYVQQFISNKHSDKQVTQNITNEISPADEIKKLKELLDMGVITQEEFDAKKKQLLGL